MYEYVVDIQLKTDTWGAIKRGVTTKSLNTSEQTAESDEDGSGSQKKKKNMNRTLLLGGRKDGYICVYDWETGKVDFKIDVSSRGDLGCFISVLFLASFFIFLAYLLLHLTSTSPTLNPAS